MLKTLHLSDNLRKLNVESGRQDDTVWADRMNFITVEDLEQVRRELQRHRQRPSWRSFRTLAVGPYEFTHLAGSLPPGVSLSTSGMHATAGAYHFTLLATDTSSGGGAVRDYTLTVE